MFNTQFSTHNFQPRQEVLSSLRWTFKIRCWILIIWKNGSIRKHRHPTNFQRTIFNRGWKLHLRSNEHWKLCVDCWTFSKKGKIQIL